MHSNVANHVKRGDGVKNLALQHFSKFQFDNVWTPSMVVDGISENAILSISYSWTLQLSRFTKVRPEIQGIALAFKLFLSYLTTEVLKRLKTEVTKRCAFTAINGSQRCGMWCFELYWTKTIHHHIITSHGEDGCRPQWPLYPRNNYLTVA